MAKSATKEVSLAAVVGKGYQKFWADRHRYRVVKGGRASKKSRTMSLWSIVNIMKYPQANMLVVRQVYNTHKDSTFAVLKWAASRLGVYHLWKFTESPLEATYKPTGQKILFRGFDDPVKLTSITVSVGVLCWVWIEEAFEIESEDEFRTLDETIRGEMPDGLWKQLTLTFNPWVNSHWTKTRFFDHKDPDAFTLTTTYECNEWLDDADKKLILDLKETNPERFKVVGLGEYGIPGGAFFEEFRYDLHTVDPSQILPGWRRYRAIDYGLDMFACLWIAVDYNGRAYVYREYQMGNDLPGGHGLIVSEAAQIMLEMTLPGENIEATYAPPDLWSTQKDTGRTMYEVFCASGVSLIKAPNARVQGWSMLKEYLKPADNGVPMLLIMRNCKQLITNLPVLRTDDKKPNDVDTEPHNITHICDALRYFCQSRTLNAEPEAPATDRDFGRDRQESYEEYMTGGDIDRSYIDF